MPRIGLLDSRSVDSQTRCSGRSRRAALVLVLCGVMTGPAPARAGAGFTIGGRLVAPQDTNFAGTRHASPKYRIAVQINHDTLSAPNLELTAVDEVFAALLAHHGRQPYLPVETVPIVFVADVKMRRFIEGPQRLLFGRLETEIKKQHDVYPSPNAIFLADATLADAEKLRAALRLGLGYLFNADFYRAVVGLDHAVPRPAD